MKCVYTNRSQNIQCNSYVIIGDLLKLKTWKKYTQ